MKFLKVFDKQYLSSLLIALFTIATFALFISTEFFQTPIETKTAFDKYRYLFASEKLNNLSTLQIKNRLGSFSLKKNSADQWEMTSPRISHANKVIIDQLIKTLGEIQIKEILIKDSINLSNYSIKNSDLRLTISFLKDDKKIPIILGLTNSIDQSTYLTLGKSDVIYHTTEFTFPLEKLDLNNLIESRLFAFEYNNKLPFKLLIKNKNNIILSLEKNDSKIINLKNGKEIDQSELEQFLSNFKNIKGQFILDQINDEQKNIISKNLESNFIQISISNGDEFHSTYTISSPLYSLPDIITDKSKNYLFKQDNADSYPILINEETFQKIVNSVI